MNDRTKTLSAYGELKPRGFKDIFIYAKNTCSIEVLHAKKELEKSKSYDDPDDAGVCAMITYLSTPIRYPLYLMEGFGLLIKHKFSKKNIPLERKIFE